MCDSLCCAFDGGVLFAKNSDRRPTEAAVVRTAVSRPAGRGLRAQYLTISDVGANSWLGAGPDWLWGLEHGVNEHGVAIGNEKLWSAQRPVKEPTALIGMDLVRLALERSRSAEGAVEVMAELLEEFGQGGCCDPATGEAYYSSFLVADGSGAWVMETSGASWAAEAVNLPAAISNRYCLGGNWDRASADVAPGRSAQEWQHPGASTLHADVRLARARQALTRPLSPTDVAQLLRDHGRPGLALPPDDPGDGSTTSLCMHRDGLSATTSSLIAHLHPERGPRAWVCLGSPCAGVFVPARPPTSGGTTHVALADQGLWRQVSAVTNALEVGRLDPGQVRERLDPLERELWQQAQSLDEASGTEWAAFSAGGFDRVREALGALTD